MSSVPYRKAAIEAARLLALISGREAARFGLSGEDVLHPDRTIRQALAEAQSVLNNVGVAAVESRVRSLERIHQKQRYLNLLHLLTGSGFVLLLTNHFEEPMKWIGAILSLGAGLFALWLPMNVPEIERTVFDGTKTIASLSKEITRIEIELLLKKGEIDDAMAERIATVIATCTEEAVKWKLGKVAGDAGVYPPPVVAEPSQKPLENPKQ
jgi:hypothetical protein